MKGVRVVVLAAGKGTRMKSGLAKALHAVAGLPMVRYPVEAALALEPDRTLVVVGHQAEAVREALDRPGVSFVLQRRLRGTGDAVAAAAPRLRGAATVLILPADAPLLTTETLRALLEIHRERGATVSFLTARPADPFGYGRVVRSTSGEVLRIVEERDAAEEERRIREVNAGVYAVEGRFLLRALRTLSNRNAQREYYLTTIVEAALAEGRPVATYEAPRAGEALGVNTRVELARAAATIVERTRTSLMLAGVTFLDPATAYVERTVRAGRDTVVGPHTTLLGTTVVGTGCRIDAGAVLEDARLGDDVWVRPGSVLSRCRVGSRSTIGPMAHLRPETLVAEEVRVGNFVEIKKSRLERGAKAPHLTYLGDASVGKRVNVGAGTITCNYDGFAKHPTVIEEGAFIGSDVQLVAPVRVGKNAIVAAGSTITSDVPPRALAVARGRQRVIEDYYDAWVRRGRRRAAGTRKAGG